MRRRLLQPEDRGRDQGLSAVSQKRMRHFSLPFFWMSLYLRWHPGYRCLGSPQASHREPWHSQCPASACPLGFSLLCGAGRLKAPARLLPPSSWAKKAEAGGQAFPLHPHLRESWPVCSPGESPPQDRAGAAPWPPRDGGTLEAPHFWRSTFLPDFQGFLLNPVRNLRGKLRKTPQGSPQTANEPRGPCSGQGARMGSKLSSSGGRSWSPSP